MTRIDTDRMFEIIAAAQRSLKGRPDDFLAVPLHELRQANQMLGDRDFNANFRLHMRDRIADLQAEQMRRSDEILQRRGYLISTIQGIFLVLVGAAIGVAVDRILLAGG